MSLVMLLAINRFKLLPQVLIVGKSLILFQTLFHLALQTSCLSTIIFTVD